MQIWDRYFPLKTKQWFVSKVSSSKRRRQQQPQSWLAPAPAESQREVSCFWGDQTASLRRQAQTRQTCSRDPSLLVPSSTHCPRKELWESFGFWGEKQITVVISYPDFSSYWDSTARVILPRVRATDAAGPKMPPHPPPTRAQTRTESRSREETGKERSGCFKVITVVRLGGAVRGARRGVRVQVPGSARWGTRGRRARARWGPSPGRRCGDAYFSQSHCLRGIRREPKSLRTAEAFASGTRGAVPPASLRPAGGCPKLWPAPPRLGARDKPGKEREAQLPPGAGLLAASRPWG